MKTRETVLLDVNASVRAPLVRVFDQIFEI
jgi:hypothetical protein